MNGARLEKSLRLLRELNDLRLRRLFASARELELRLRQHDYDARDKIDPRQLSIFDVPKK